MFDFDKLVIIGAGFAGIGSALQARCLNKRVDIILLEKQARLLPWLARKGLSAYPLGTVAESRFDSQDSRREDVRFGSLLRAWDPATLMDWLGEYCPNVTDPDAGSILFNEPQRLRTIFTKLLNEHRIEVDLGFAMESFARQGDGAFRVWSQDGRVHRADRLILATGGERNHALKLAAETGAEVVEPVAGYVRLKLASRQIGERLGPLERNVIVRYAKSDLFASGRLKLSPRGLEGPVISMLSASSCREWHARGYTFPLEINWLPEQPPAMVIRELLNRKEQGGKRLLVDTPMFGFSQRSWAWMLKASKIEDATTWSRVRLKKLQSLAHRLKSDRVNVRGMGLPDGERAWAGGIVLDSLYQDRLESRVTPGLFFAGELLDMTGQPGGYHQDLVWASSRVAACGAAKT